MKRILKIAIWLIGAVCALALVPVPVYLKDGPDWYAWGVLALIGVATTGEIVRCQLNPDEWGRTFTPFRWAFLAGMGWILATAGIIGLGYVGGA